MAFTPAQVAFLHRLVTQRPGTRQAGDHANFFAEHFQIGVLVGRRVEYLEIHFSRAESILRTNDLPAAPLPAGASRADAAAFGGMSEKDFSAAPHSNSVAVKALGRCLLGGRELFAPRGGYMVVTVQQAVEVTCERLLLVENLETFRRLESYSWIDGAGRDVLVMYRGDSQLPGPDVVQVLASRSEPIWAFTDFDPAGLGIAASLPAGRLERLVLPAKSWLAREANSARGRQLFDSQVGQYRRILESARNPEIGEAWALMKGLQSAVTQERMASARPETP